MRIFWLVLGVTAGLYAVVQLTSPNPVWMVIPFVVVAGGAFVMARRNF